MACICNEGVVPSIFHVSRQELFFSYINERQRIMERKEAGEAWPWTFDVTLRDGYFCSVYREDDKVTRWHADNLRNAYGDNPELTLLANVAFRSFNWPQTGQTLLDCDLIQHWDLETAVSEIHKQDQKISGAYILKGYTCGDKVRGLAMIVDDFHSHLTERTEALMSMNTLAEQYQYLRTIPFMGPFTAYQLLQDLRRTVVSSGRLDRRTFAVAGPGAKRGLNRYHKRPVDQVLSPEQAHFEMVEIQQKSPQYTDLHLDVSDVQHNLCEYDKYLRVLLGEGRMKKKYKRRT